MKSYIFEGKTEEDALLKASGELGINISSMKYEILEKETKIFGLLGKNVKIRVFVDDSQEKKEISKAEKAKEVLSQLLEKMDVHAEVKVEESDKNIVLNIVTEEEEIIVGKDGKVLSAIQLIIDKIVNKFPEQRKRIILDSCGFRGKREEHLKKMAKELGEKAKQLGKTIRIFSMSPNDRRIIHFVLSEMEGITTRSEGRGSYRKLLIIPSKDNSKFERHKEMRKRRV